MPTRLTSSAQAFAVDLSSNSSSQEHNLGTKAETSDGRMFRYCKVGASTALVAGTLIDGPATISAHTNIAVAAVAAIGATSVTVTLGATAATLNQYADGQMIVNDATGEGYAYRIKSNPAAALSTNLTVTLDDALQVALDTTSEITLIPNQYNGGVIHAQSEAGVPVGVAVKIITAAYYGWIQTRGTVSCLHDASPAEIGEGVSASTTTDGCVTELAASLGVVGYALAQGVSTEYNPIFLTID